MTTLGVPERGSVSDPAVADPVGRSLLEAALSYAERGWCVFPLHSLTTAGCSCGRTCKSPGKHPRTANGLKDATTDPERIARWWGEWPDANIGIRTGSESGLVVLDLDLRDGEATGLLELEAEHGRLPDTVTVVTGGGGLHLYFRHPGMTIRNSAGRLGAGVDVRGDGGYVVAPPSMHPSGGLYRWAQQKSPVEAALAVCPGWMCDPEPRGGAPEAVGQDAVIAEGARNQTLTSYAGQMRYAGMERHELTAALKAINSERCLPPLADWEVEGIAASVACYPKGARRYKPTDLGTAERFIDFHGDDVRFVPGIGWYVWDGGRWARDESGTTLSMLKHVVRRMWEAPETIDHWIWEIKDVYLRRAESNAGLRAALAVCESEPTVVVAAESLDRDPWLLNVANGTLDLRTRVLREPERADLITKQCPVAYNPDARSPQWELFLERITGNDRELSRFLQTMAGYLLTGDTSEEKLFFTHGPGATGKSTFLEALKAMLGDYATTADFETFLKKRGGSGIRNDIARLRGARLVISIEVDEGQELAQSIVKQLTGGDTISARFLYKEFFEFIPQFKLCLAANDRPRVSSSDSGMWRRIVQVPFTVVIPEAERDPRLKRLLKTDPQAQEAILAWAVEGCLRWQREGLVIPERVRAYTEEYRAENDPLAEFLDDCCVLEPGALVPRSQLRQAYEQWSRENGNHYLLGAKRFAKHLREHGVSEGDRKIGSDRTWTGIRLRPELTATTVRNDVF